MSDLLIGVGLSTSAAPDADPVADARRAETAGYDFVSASDHPVGVHPTFDTLTLLTWVAAGTSTVGVATRVLGVPFRRPAVVAKTAESLQRLSGGRLILGLGGGYSDDEIVAVGGAAPGPRSKVDGMADAITIMRRAWTESEVDYDGPEYAVRGLTLEPKPSRPIPVWLGTYGPRALAVTGRLADGWIPSLGHAAPARVPEMLTRIREASVAAGRPVDAVRAVYNVGVRLDPHGRSTDDAIIGSAADIVDQILGLRQLGFTAFNLAPDEDQQSAVAAEVLPALRTAAVAA